MAWPGGTSVDPELDAQVERIFGCFLTGPVCLDTMVPLYFEIHGIADKFKGLFKDRSHMPPAVFRELDGHLRGRGAAGTLLQSPRFFRIEPITDDAMAERVLDRQRRWRGKEAAEADPLPDRGEAECLEVCLDKGLPLLSHDHNAIRDADREGIVIGTTIDVLAVMVFRGVFNTTQAWMIYKSFARAGLYPVRRYPADGAGEARFAELIKRCQARKAASPKPPATPTA
jgi:predicted nucleic acid-binding protein